METIHHRLCAVLPPASPGMLRMIKFLHGSTPIAEKAIVAMLPEQVAIICTEEPESDDETEDESLSLDLFG